MPFFKSRGYRGSRHKGRAFPLLGQNFFIFMQFLEKIGQIAGWRPLGNPGSVTAIADVFSRKLCSIFHPRNRVHNIHNSLSYQRICRRNLKRFMKMVLHTINHPSQFSTCATKTFRSAKDTTHWFCLSFAQKHKMNITVCTSMSPINTCLYLE